MFTLGLPEQNRNRFGKKTLLALTVHHVWYTSAIGLVFGDHDKTLK